jgi:hypothetical protein
VIAERARRGAARARFTAPCPEPHEDAATALAKDY